MARKQFYTIEQLGKKQSLTPEGFLLCEDVPISRTGMMIYGPDETPIGAGPDGIVKIFRADEDVFRPETIASALGKPITNEHPDEDVTPDSWKDLAHGVVLNVRRGTGALDDLLLSDFLITTPEGIEEVRSGKREVSMGYDADYEEIAPGAGKQTNIIVNHVALVEKGRCGPRCSIGDRKHSEIDMAKKTKMSVKDLLRRAYRAKDEAELEKIEKEVEDELVKINDEELESEGGEKETHIHLHHGGEGEGGDQEIGRQTFTDDDINEFIAKNDSEHADMFGRIGKLEEAIGALLERESEEHFMDEMSGEMPEEKRENFKANDSAFMQDTFRSVVAQAEILSPGIKVPTFDSSKSPKKTYKSICKLRRKSIDAAYQVNDTQVIIDSLLGGKKLDTKNMSCAAIRTLFQGAVSLRQSQNNLTGRTGTLDKEASKPKGIISIADLNAFNKQKYNK